MANQKQKDLEAGKRRLEEFRKKKAADRVKKGASASLNLKSDNDKRPSEVENARFAEVDGVVTSYGVGKAVTNSNITTITNNGKSTSGSGQFDEAVASSMKNVGTPLLNNDFNALSTYTVDINQRNDKNDVNDTYREFSGTQHEFRDGTTFNHLLPRHLHGSQDFDSSNSPSSFYVDDEAQSYKSESSSIFVSKILSQNSVNEQSQNKQTYTTTLGSVIMDGPLDEDYSQATRNVNSSTNDVAHNMHDSGGFTDSIVSNRGSASAQFPRIYSEGIKETEAPGSYASISSNHAPKFSVKNESTPWRPRESFVGSLDKTRLTSGSLFQQMKLEKGSSITDVKESNGLSLPGSITSSEPSMRAESLLPSLSSRNPSLLVASEGSGCEIQCTEKKDFNENRMDSKYEFYSSRQNEDFAALEQHIEDLTQEKFSLQRALEASRTLAESLAAENSSLTDNYNQQRSVVNQLKYEIEQLQEEIKARMAELESVKGAVVNAHLECNAADERAKLLASEVISLEEKALRLRSNELKLEKHLENVEAEIASCRKKMSSLEKERLDLQSTIDALQEEKKLMQYKLQKVSGTAKSVDLSKSPASKKDVSTSTEDINADANSDIRDTPDSDAVFNVNASGSLLVIENVNHGFSYENIPYDQLRTIENINALIVELSLEKEELLSALTSESSQCSKLKELNMDLARKLEVQTQRLELLTAQSMVNGVVPAKLDSPTVQDNAPYADEGDEVVERVLGWIMKLFPGGPSRRRTSKLL